MTAAQSAIDQTLEVLGYKGSANFLLRNSPELDSAVDLAHIFRKAVADCSLRGVYVLRPDSKSAESITPVVYVCEATDDAAAEAIHKRVWNQNIVPFVVVHTPRCVRLYSGFRYSEPAQSDPKRGVLRTATAFNEIAAAMAGLTAEAIDTGVIWREWAEAVTPDTRVDWTLLDHLRRLEDMLRKQDLDRGTSHALIGKFVYLRYLRDRGILSDRKLDRWNIDPKDLFSRNATLAAFWAANDQLDEWLNGAVFPLSTRKDAIKSTHLKKVAGVFFGDDPAGQLHLDFGAYDFSCIPTETLSSIYEQFVHAPEDDGKSLGKEAGAFYTPVPLVNFVLNELDQARSLQEGMKVLDPACGSGAFLVQCYRRLIERKKRAARKAQLTLRELRDLLTDHIYGVEKDGDACQVTSLSLVLTLLDCVEPPDLENNPTFKLPSLANKNVFEADFFDPDSTWARAAAQLRFDWVVGNPPWKDLKLRTAPVSDPHAWACMQKNAKSMPAGGNQLAELFVWKVIGCMSCGAVAGLVLPAMTLFKHESADFRRKLFREHSVWCIANFANLAYVLFGGRAERPASVFFFRETPPKEDSRILTYAPLIVNQEANRPMPGRKTTTWNIVVDSSDIRELRAQEAAEGGMLLWKLAMWGSHRDGALLARVGSRFSSLLAFGAKHGIVARQGPELRETGVKGTEFVPELANQKLVRLRELRNSGRLFWLPEDAIGHISPRKAYLRLRGGKAGLDVCRPPHIIVDAARRFAIYTDDFVVVPPRQIGIAGPKEKSDILRALSLYLNSDFALYYQFFFSPAWGIDTSVATLDALQNLPVPVEHLDSKELAKWVAMQKRLEIPQPLDALSEQGQRAALPEELDTLNGWVYSLLGLHPSEQILVQDFVRNKLQALKGKVTADSLRIPAQGEMDAYLKTLKKELDNFVEIVAKRYHRVQAVVAEHSSMICIDLVGRREAATQSIVTADSLTAAALTDAMRRLRRQHSQWLYFDRSLKICEGSRTYLFKPNQRMHWTRTQALLDADDLIADTLGNEDSPCVQQ